MRTSASTDPVAKYLHAVVVAVTVTVAVAVAVAVTVAVAVLLPLVRGASGGFTETQGSK